MLKRHARTFFIVAMVLLVARVVLPQLDALKDSLETLQEADLVFVLIGLLVYLFGVPVTALQFMVLALKKVTYWLTFKVQGANLFISKLLPAGMGTLSVNLYYLVKRNHTASEASSVIAMNAITSTTAYSILILLALSVSSLSLDGLFNAVELPVNAILFVLLLLVGALLVLQNSTLLRQKWSRTWHTFKQNFAHYKERKPQVLYGTLLNGMGTALNVAAMVFAARALDLELSLAEALLAYTFGNIASALIPTPGGLGSAEAGIYSGLVMVGLDTSNAIAVTLLYRLITYWLPLVPGYVFFWNLRKDLLSDYSMHSHNKKPVKAKT